MKPTPLDTPRPQFTVVTKDGVRYDANQLTVCWEAGTHAIAFLSSGHLTHVMANEIKAIEFSPEGGNRCPHCEQLIVMES